VSRIATAIATLMVWTACQAPPPAPPAAIEKTADDGTVALTLRVDRDRISVADNVHIRIEAAFPESKQIDFPDTLGDEADFRSASTDATSPRLGEDGKVRVEQSYLIEPYVAGKLTIPAIEVRYRDKSALEDEKTVATEPFEIEVEAVPSAEEETADLRDIHDPLAVPFPMAWLIGGTLAALAAAAAAWYWWKSRQTPAPMVETPPDPADVIALRELDQLVARGLAVEGRIKELYAGVSDILRHYIEARFGLHAPEQTTEEFLFELRRTLGFDPVHRALLRQFLEHTDMVKFAEVRPAPPQIDDTIAACRRFIIETKAQPLAQAVEGPVVPRA
jgi:hypothetical protein